MSHSAGSEPGQVADEEQDDVAGVDVGADGPVGFALLAEEGGQLLGDRVKGARGWPDACEMLS